MMITAKEFLPTVESGLRHDDSNKSRRQTFFVHAAYCYLKRTCLVLLLSTSAGALLHGQDLNVNGKLTAIELEAGDHHASACLSRSPGGLCLEWGVATEVTPGLHVTSATTTVGVPAIFQSSISFGTQENQMINLFNTNYGIGVQDYGFYQRSDRDFVWYKGGQQRSPQDGQGGGVMLMHLDGNGNLMTAGSVSTQGVQVSEGGSVITPVLQITGGSDLAEPFQTSQENIPKGSVLIIDEQNPGRLRVSEHAYDARVAGVVSGANGINPGISLSQRGILEGGQDVALSGRVYVRADASYGPIKPGDLLTTSDTTGHAMKATDQMKARGAILGKAMSPLPEGTGLVLVLVSLE
jgi:hypothetical protein